MNHSVPFHPADILLPVHPTDRYPVVACDQYTSEPNYWEQVERIVGDAPSTLRLTLPEIYLKEEDLPERIEAVNASMERYLSEGVLKEYPDAMILVERRLADGRCRMGLIGAVDLDAYDHTPGTRAMIRATEGTVLERIPPRVAVRKGAFIELPHVMLLLDDPEKTVIEPLIGNGEQIYDLTLMQGGGSVKGWLLDEGAKERVLSTLGALCEGEDPMLFAVGDGNHSLATAKACAALSPSPLASRALVEVVNLHDPALDFEPIYRVLFGVNAEEVFAAAEAFFDGGEGKEITLLAGNRRMTVKAEGLICEKVQAFLDSYLATHPEGEVDYIHGEEVVERLSTEEGTVGFLFPGIAKSELFPYVKAQGSLPRKTFSMGHAHDKRYYLEGRRIR